MAEYIAYDYKELKTERSAAPFFHDSYECFGWEIKELPDGTTLHDSLQAGQKQVILQMKRDRNITSKPELTRLQGNFEACVREIAALEREKTKLADIVSIAVGVAGAAFLAAAVMAFCAVPPLYALFAVTALPGIACWILPYFLYRKIKEKQTARMEPLIEKKKEEMYEVCGKASRLLERQVFRH